MYKQKSIQSRLKIFADLFNTIFTIVGFSVKKNKICAEMINPIIQYLVIESSFDKNFELLLYTCFYSVQSRPWNGAAVPKFCTIWHCMKVPLCMCSKIWVKIIHYNVSEHKNDSFCFNIFCFYWDPLNLWMKNCFIYRKNILYFWQFNFCTFPNCRR